VDANPVISSEPLVSVLMNCFNGAKYLQQAIESVLAQTYQNWEIIFWDNQSTDRTAEIVARYPDRRLKYFYAPSHTQLYEARNRAIEYASGELIGFLDVDDWWMPNKLEEQVALFSDPQVGMVCGNYFIYSERKKTYYKLTSGHLPTGWVLNALLKSYFVGLLTLMVRKSALDAFNPPTNPRYHIIGDFDLVVRLSTSWKLACVQNPVAFYRVHDSSEMRKSHLHIAELENCMDEMNKVESIRSSPNFYCVLHEIAYLKAKVRRASGDIKGAYRLFHELEWGRLKLRLLVILLLPNGVTRWLRA